MARPVTGSVRLRSGIWCARVKFPDGARVEYKLVTCRTEDAARERALALSSIAARLVSAGQAPLAAALVERAAGADQATFDQISRKVTALAAGQIGVSVLRPVVTLEVLARRWTSGELAREYPDHIREKRSAKTDEGRIRLHIIDAGFGDIDVAEFTLDHADAIMQALPAHLSAASRRHVGQLLHRLMGLAVYPLRLRADNPIPEGWLPRLGASKAFSFIYPSEDAALLACSAVSLADRVFYGFLAREGMRCSEALSLRWKDLDLQRGVVTLDVNKTDSPRAWALSPGVAAALLAWREQTGGEDTDQVFAGRVAGHGAGRLRRHLELAGVERAELFERTKRREPIRAHDLRGSFVTWSLAMGRTETWVTDRTGHKSSIMLRRYQRAARTAAELGLGTPLPLDEAIPELKGYGTDSGTPSIGRGSGHEVGVSAIHRYLKPSSPGRGRTDTPLRAADFKTERGGRENAGSVVSSGKADPAHDTKAPLETARPTSGPTSARVDSFALLTSELARLAASGDVEGARVMHEAIGRLLAAPAPVTSEATPSSTLPVAAPAPPGVVDLAQERRRRGDGSR